MKDLKSELSGNFWDVVQGLMMTPAQYDAYQLNKAIKVRRSCDLQSETHMPSVKTVSVFAGPY